MKALKEWWSRIAMAMWVHQEFDQSKRRTIFGAAALVATALMPQLVIRTVRAFDVTEHKAVIRRAFVPRLYVQLWESSPLMEQLMKAA